jgi:hypothetical protein
VTCSGCGQANPAAVQFCGGCGARLAAVCPACQTPNPPGNRFCHRCGASLGPTAAAERPPSAYTPKHLAEKILTTAGALKGERKQVTVLFVDVSGFTSLSESLDPEEVHRLMSRAFDLMLAEVHRYEAWPTGRCARALPRGLGYHHPTTRGHPGSGAAGRARIITPHS